MNVIHIKPDLNIYNNYNILRIQKNVLNLRAMLPSLAFDCKKKGYEFDPVRGNGLFSFPRVKMKHGV